MRLGAQPGRGRLYRTGQHLIKVLEQSCRELVVIVLRSWFFAGAFYRRGTGRDAFLDFRRP